MDPLWQNFLDLRLSKTWQSRAKWVNLVSKRVQLLDMAHHFDMIHNSTNVKMSLRVRKCYATHMVLFIFGDHSGDHSNRKQSRATILALEILSWPNMGHDGRKPVFWICKQQGAVWSVPLLFAYWKLSHI